MQESEKTGLEVPPGAIANQIQTLLKERYKEGFPIIKEILQNANDAGATRLDMGVTPGLSSTEVDHPLLEQPSLFFVNNGGFQDSDAKAIGWIGIDFNAGNSAKIGKFGLGQKSVFHFCESFFYIAKSDQLSEKARSYRFLTPWADGQPMTPRDKSAVENYLEDILITQNHSNYFILWLPLRISNQPRALLSKTYDYHTIQQHLPKDLDRRISTLIPCLNSLQSICYWVFSHQDRIQKLSIQLETLDQRFTYPRADGNLSEHNIKHPFRGSIQLSNHQASYGGIEASLPEQPFQGLLADQPDLNGDFWTVLRESDHWPKRSSYNDVTGESITVEDKAIPHCGAVFFRQPANAESHLIIQWAVFLPLADEDGNHAVHECISIEGTQDYTLMLHGYFFLDSGRQSIEGLDELYAGNSSSQTPSNDTEMISAWNTILATQGTLPQILPALNEFCESSELEQSDIGVLCKALKQSKLFQTQVLHQYLYQPGYWVYRVQPAGTRWQLVDDPQQRILAVPRCLNWNAWSALTQVANSTCLIIEDDPNLIPLDKPDDWADDEIITVLNSLDIIYIVQNGAELQFLVSWLDIVIPTSSDKAISDDAQESLQNQVRSALVNLEFRQLEQQRSLIKLVISRLSPSRWFCIKCSNQELLKHLNQNQDILLIPNQICPTYESQTLSGHNAVLIISILLKHTNEKLHIVDIIHQVIRAIPDHDLSEFWSQTDTLPFIFGQNYRTGDEILYTLQEISELRGFAFKKSTVENDFARSLQDALEGTEIILIDREIADKLCESLPECNRTACLSILEKRPHLATPKNRINLLRRLLS